MKAFCLLLFCLVLLTAGTSAQSVKRVAFDRYPIKVEAARVKKLDFKHDPDASVYRTRLSAALRGGVNFSGHYIITGWGCGTGCTNGAIIETRSGRVIWPQQLMNLDARYGDEYSEEQIEFRKDSRLLIIHGVPGADENAPTKCSGDHYYEWKNEKLHLLKSLCKAPN